LNFIAALDENWGIGRAGDLLFHIPEDMKYFREKTMGKVVVMGEATLRSLPGGKPLPGRTNIVLSDDVSFGCKGAALCRTMDELFDMLGRYDSRDVFVIGGASVYNQLMDCCDTAYITKVAASVPADVSINPLDGREGWALESRSAPHSHKGLAFTFCVYRNAKITPRPGGTAG
jgi:dihydrofolate reductase